jgi:hypothetical protein
MPPSNTKGPSHDFLELHDTTLQPVKALAMVRERGLDLPQDAENEIVGLFRHLTARPK